MKELKNMTVYQYYQEMQQLCARLANAFRKSDGDKEPLVDVYSIAEEGFYQKTLNISVDQANRLCAKERLERLEDFRWYVQGKEDSAAWAIREKEKAAQKKGS